MDLQSEPSTFDALVANYRDEVFHQAFAILRHQQAAEDVVQETFLEAFLSLARLKNPDSTGAWLRAIARHQCYRVLRSRDLELLPPEFTDQLPDGAASAPDTRTEVNDARAALEQLLRALPPQLRDAAMLFYVKQCSQREAAAFLSIPITTLNNRLHAARATIKERMGRMSARPATHEPAANVGTIISVRGPIIEARFGDEAPDVFDALAASDATGHAVESMKVAQRTDGVVRCIATTDESSALRPGMNVINTRSVGVGLTPWVGVTPVSDDALTRAVKQLADAQAPREDLILETGIKPIDLFAPITQGATMALLGIQGVGRIVLVEELIHRLSRAAASLRIVYLVEPNEPDSVRGMLTQEKEYPGDVVGNVETWWMLSEMAVDPEAARATRVFDAQVYCSPLLGVQGLYPAVDPLASRSRALDERRVSVEHVETAERSRDLLRRAWALMTDSILLELLANRAKKKAWQRAKEFPMQRMAELSAEDRLLVCRARKLERFLTTPFFVAEPFAHRAGKHVTIDQTIAACRSILDGRLDDVPEDALLYIGAIEERSR